MYFNFDKIYINVFNENHAKNDDIITYNKQNIYNYG